ncbi:hypothetical protein AMTRI_Chr08g203130 [Amborella trichopoda]
MEGKRAKEVKVQRGHKTSHAKPRKPKAKKVGAQKHQCFMCNTDFDKGQALGGHMRCHGKELSRRKAQAQEQPSKEVHEQKLIRQQTY